MKKFSITFLIITIIVGLGALYWFLIRGMVKDYPSPARVIPEDAFLVYKGQKFRNTYETFRETPLAQEISDHPKFDSLNQQFDHLDSIISQSKALANFLHQKSLHISLQNVSVDEISLLGALQTKSLNPLDAFKTIIEKNGPDCSFKSRQLNNYQVIDVVSNKSQSKTILTFSAIEGILLVSPNALMVEDAIRAFNQKKGESLSGIYQAIANHDKPERLFVHFDNLPVFLKTFSSYKTREFLSSHRVLPGFASYEILFQEETLQLHGNYRFKNNSPLLREIQKNQPQASQLPNIVPFRTAFFHSFQFSNAKTYYESLKNSYKKQDRFLKFKHYKDSLENQKDFSIKEDFLPILGQEIALVVNEPVSSDFSRNLFLAMHAQNAPEKINKLQALKKKLEKGSPSTTATSDYRDYTINRLPLEGIFPFLFGDFFKGIQAPFFTRLGDFILFANATGTLKRIIDDYEAGQTLAASSHYTRLKEHILSESNMYFYLNPNRANMLPLNFLKPSLKGPFRKDFPYYNKLGGVVFQLVKEGKNFFSQITIQKASETTDNTAKLWQQKLDNPLAQPPQIVDNHENQQKEILLTDSAHSIHLMNNSGSILWKKSFNEPIMGPSDQIDLYKNGNLQYVFATKNHLQLVDRKGRDVASFPISLSAPASTELVAFDYNNNKNYQYFIGCQNKNVYGYYAAGNPLGGWSPQSLEAPLDHPVKYFQYGGKIYLYGVSRKGTFYLWNKNGETAFKRKFKTRFPNHFKIHFGEADSTTYMASPDTSGMTHFVYLDGDTAKQRYGNFKGNHYFHLKDFSRNGKKDFIFSMGTSLKGFHRDSTKAFSLTMADTLSYPPQFFTINEKPYIGYVSQQTNQIFLVDQEGTFYPGFPLKGSTPFSIDDINNDGELELVVGGKNGVVYLYKLK